MLLFGFFLYTEMHWNVCYCWCELKILNKLPVAVI